MTIGDRGMPPDAAVDDLVFLARSRHRIQLLTQLSREERTRRNLHDATGISQPTLGRILGDFEDRRWVSNNHNGAYSLTPLGVLLSEDVGDVLAILDTIQQIDDLAEHLPLEELPFDLRHFSTARITTPSPSDPLAHMRRFDELAVHAATVWAFSNVLSCAPAHESSDADREFLAHVDELIVTQDGLATGFDDPELERWLRDRIATGDLSLYRHEQAAVLLFGVFDETVGIVPIDDAGVPCGLIETETDPIRTWGEETFEAYRRGAERITPEAVPT